jgi:DNA mismatch repair protein MSH4
LYSFDALVRPNFTTEGPIAIKQGRHPILEKSSNAGYFVPVSSFVITHDLQNDTYISESGNFQIVTGPNMSGKSIYLRQIACITIMAHCGSFVPAKFASIRVVDKLFTRIGTDDSMESNASTFMVEMKEMAHIVQNATNKSLILIDELGRGTSNVEGSAIAWSICEYLMSLKAYTIFVTHYVQLTELELLYPNVKNYHLMVTTHIDGKLNFLYSVGEGSCSEARYGLKLAKMLGLPKDILEDADNICQQVLEERQKKNQSLKEKSKQTNKLRATYQLAQRILALKHSTLDLKALTIYLRKLGAQHVKPTDNQEEENS